MTDKVMPFTKRKGLRFSIKPRTISYRANDQKGEALIADISAGGCLVKDATLPLSPQDNVVFLLDFIDPDNSIEVEAVVMRAQENAFAVKFLNIPEELKISMVKFFARDIREIRQQSG